MRKLLVFLAVAAAFVVSLSAFDRPLGAIISPDGGCFNNLSPFYIPALYPDAGPFTDGGVTTDGGSVFNIPGGATVVVQCNQQACVGVGDAGVKSATTCTMGAPGTGVVVGAYATPWPITMGGWENQSAIAMCPLVVSATAARCEVWQVINTGYPYSPIVGLKKPKVK